VSTQGRCNVVLQDQAFSKIVVYGTARVESESTLRDEAKAVQANVEHEQRVHGQRDPVLDHAAAAQNADACCERPET
jgi:hypothetical protein